MKDIINQVLILFFIMAVGIYARKRKIINDELSKGLSDLLLSVTMPLMIVASFNVPFSVKMLNDSVFLVLCSVAIYLATIFISKLIYNRYPDNIRKVLRFITIFSNCGFMGYPVIESIYGKTGLFYTVAFNIPFTVFFWTVGVMLFTDKKDLKSTLKMIINPGIVATVIGLVLFFFSIEMPYAVYKACDLVGSMTTPVSMLVIGAMLADINIKDVFSGFAIYYGTIIRLLAIPLVIYGVLKLFGVHGILLGIPVITMAMPAAAGTSIFAQKYNGDFAFSSRCVFLTTALSLITIPGFMLLVSL